MRGRTSIVIAHRLSTVRRATRIVVIHHGRIAEQGTPRRRCSPRGGIYARPLPPADDRATAPVLGGSNAAERRGRAERIRRFPPVWRFRRFARMTSVRDIRAARLAAEVGTIHKQAALRVRARLPEPVHGRDVVARVPDHLPDAQRPARTSAPSARSCPTTSRAARASARAAAHLRIGAPGRRLPDRRVLARLRAGARRRWSTAWTWPASRRSPTSAPAAPARVPLIVIGGPLTFSNPVPAAPFADVILLGEAEETLPELVDGAARGAGSRARCWPAWPRAPASTCRRSTATRLPAVAAADGRAPARALADPHAAHRARATCS